MPDRNAGEPGEGRIDEIIVAADAKDARVGVEALKDRVRDIARRSGLGRPIVAAIIEPVEARRRLRWAAPSRAGGRATAASASSLDAWLRRAPANAAAIALRIGLGRNFNIIRQCRASAACRRADRSLRASCSGRSSPSTRMSPSCG